MRFVCPCFWTASPYGWYVGHRCQPAELLWPRERALSDRYVFYVLRQRARLTSQLICPRRQRYDLTGPSGVVAPRFVDGEEVGCPGSHVTCRLDHRRHRGRHDV